MAAGAPVIGLGQGGLLDTVRCLHRDDGHPTGLLFPEQSAACLAEALETFEARQLWRQLPADRQRAWAEQFGPERFQQRMAAVIADTWEQHQRQRADRARPLPDPLPTAVPLG